MGMAAILVIWLAPFELTFIPPRASPDAGYLNKSDRPNNHLKAASFYYMHNKH